MTVRPVMMRPFFQKYCSLGGRFGGPAVQQPALAAFVHGNKPRAVVEPPALAEDGVQVWHRLRVREHVACAPTAHRALSQMASCKKEEEEMRRTKGLAVGLIEVHQALLVAQARGRALAPERLRVPRVCGAERRG